MRSFARTFGRRLFHALGLEIARHSTLGFEFSRYRPKSLGINPYWDITKLIGDSRRVIVFDVGSNVGGTIESFKDRIPHCEIHGFEPSPKTYQMLVQNTESYGDTHLNNLGVGSSCGTLQFHENAISVNSSFLAPGTAFPGREVNHIPVQVITLDKYCEEHNVPSINVLKIDTQGFDLEVLKGAGTLLDANRIQMVYLELILSDMYQGLPSFDEMLRFLLDRRFKLVSFYEIHHSKNLAEWCDALFINPGFNGPEHSGGKTTNS